jgi:MraZ protein
MTLTGTHLRSIDDKRRVAVPKRLRDDFGEGDIRFLYIAPGTNKSLWLYAPDSFSQLAQRLSSRSGNQNYLRLFYSSAERVDLDAQGRIRSPDRLAEHAGLTREAYLLGVQDHAELWDKQTWDDFVTEQTPRFDELAFQALA